MYRNENSWPKPKKRKPRPKTETPKEIMPIISTIAFMAMTVY